MKVFISWSGDRSKMLAQAIRELLPDIFQLIQPFMSEADIDAGTRWHQHLNTELENTKCGILCLTPENLEKPWLLFEAGALSKTIADSLVFPCLLSPLKAGDVKYPLGQFQGKLADKNGIFDIVASINKAFADQAIEIGRLTRLFDNGWKDFEPKLKAIPIDPPAGSPKPKQRDQGEVLEEILEIVRSNSRGFMVVESYADQLNKRSEFDESIQKFFNRINKSRATDDVELLFRAFSGLKASILRFRDKYPATIPMEVNSRLSWILEETSALLKNRENENLPQHAEAICKVISETNLPTLWK